jgi:hypothetical protein
MARYELTIHFNDAKDAAETYVQLAASLIAASVESYGFIQESAELVDHLAPERRWQGGVDWLEWCQREESQEEWA